MRTKGGFRNDFSLALPWDDLVVKFKMQKIKGGKKIKVYGSIFSHGIFIGVFEKCADVRKKCDMTLFFLELKANL